jgi:hypothetical protein
MTQHAPADSKTRRLSTLAQGRKSRWEWDPAPTGALLIRRSPGTRYSHSYSQGPGQGRLQPTHADPLSCAACRDKPSKALF